MQHMETTVGKPPKLGNLSLDIREEDFLAVSPRMATTVIDTSDDFKNTHLESNKITLPVIKTEERTSDLSKKKIHLAKLSKISKHESVTKCVLCSDRFREPKCLPCLHTFCSSCLSRHISSHFKNAPVEKKTIFPCPTCRSATEPNDVSADPKDWAEQFPTDSFVLSIIEMIAFENLEKRCEPCERQQKGGVKASLWCKQCKVCLCKSCLEFHNAMFPDHSSLSISKASREPTLISDFQDIACQKHKQKLDLYCEDHKQLGCSTCVAVDHRKCLKVTTVKDRARELISDKDLKKILQRYKDCLESLDHVVTDHVRQIEQLEKGKQEITAKLTGIREEIDSHLDKIQETLLTKLSGIHKAETEKIGEQIRECRSLQTAITDTRRIVKVTSIFGSESQLISTILRAKSNSEKYTLKSIETSEASEDLDFTFQIHEYFQDLSTSMPEFGGLEIIRTKRPLPKSISKLRRMFDRRSHEVHQFYVRLTSDNFDCVITSGLYLPDGKLIVCDFQNRCVKMFRETGLFVSKLSLPTEPFGICRVDETTIAVTQPNNSEITLINVSNDQLQIAKSIDIGRVCYGIEKLGHEFVVTFPMEKPSPYISIVAIEGDIINNDTAKKIPFSHRPFHMAINKLTQEIVVTQKTSATRDNQGLVLNPDLTRNREIHNGDIRWARGVDIDQEGNVYICGQTSSTVLQFTPNGRQSRVILSSEDDIQNPAAISFCGDKFFLTDVSEGNRNTLKIFEMQ